MEFIELIGRNYPKKLTDKVSKMLNMAGSNTNPYEFTVYASLITLLIFITSVSLVYLSQDLKDLVGDISFQLFSFAPQIGFFITSVFFGVLISSVFVVLLSSYYNMKADARKNALEEIFPDFFALVSSNVRSGMNLDQALWQAAKPEFGILATEVKRAVKLSFSGEPIDKSLDYLSSRFNSPMFRRAINIIKNSIYSGGEIAKVLEKISEEASELAIIRREIRSNLIIYMIFLFFAASIGIPFMLSVSHKMLIIMDKTFSLVGESSYGNSSILPFTISKPPVSPKQFYYFSFLVILVSSITTSFLIGATYSGRKSDGIKYLPVILIIAFFVFFVSGFILDVFFSSIIPA